MTLAPASDFDLTALAAVFTAGYEGYFVPLHVDEAALRFMVDAWDIDLDRSRVALEDGEPVGLAFLAVRGDSAWIGGVGVALASRGRGIGRRLMEAVLAEAPRLGDPRGDRAERDRQAALRQPRLRGRAHARGLVADRGSTCVDCSSARRPAAARPGIAAVAAAGRVAPRELRRRRSGRRHGAVPGRERPRLGSPARGRRRGSRSDAARSRACPRNVAPLRERSRRRRQRRPPSRDSAAPSTCVSSRCVSPARRSPSDVYPEFVWTPHKLGLALAGARPEVDVALGRVAVDLGQLVVRE